MPKFGHQMSLRFVSKIVLQEARYRKESKTEREKSTYFELLIKDFLKHDPTYSPQFSNVWTFAEWAKLQDFDSRDTGIDLVAELSEEDGFCEIQCKFYDENHKIQKSDLDSFFTASGKKEFTRRLIVDTTRRDWSEHAEAALRGQTVGTLRIGLAELESRLRILVHASKPTTMYPPISMDMPLPSFNPICSHNVLSFSKGKFISTNHFVKH